MNSFAPGWDASSERHQRSARGALDRMLDRNETASRRRARDILGRAAFASPAVAMRCRRIADGRTALERTAGAVAAAGAVASVGLVAVAVVQGLPIADQALRILVAALAVGQFRLVAEAGRPSLGVQALLQFLLSILLLTGTEHLVLDAAFATLGWAAIAARGLVQSRARNFDLDEMELALAAQGRDASIEMMLRVRAAAI
ncbi:MAG: hypothetical protein ACRC1J_01490 [Sandaracinobacteroides sp.]